MLPFSIADRDRVSAGGCDRGGLDDGVRPWAGAVCRGDYVGARVEHRHRELKVGVVGAPIEVSVSPAFRLTVR